MDSNTKGAREMMKRVLVLGAVVAALTVPAVSLADGGIGSTPTTAARGGHAAGVLDRVSKRLDRRFAVFSAHCLVANAPARCTKAANRAVRRLDRLQRVLDHVESAIKTKCGAPNPPARCSNAAQVTSMIDQLLSTVGSDLAAIKAKFPNAGS
jgi:hypothetical protein